MLVRAKGRSPETWSDHFLQFHEQIASLCTPASLGPHRKAVLLPLRFTFFLVSSAGGCA
jgi:hypothetical protein